MPTSAPTNVKKAIEAACVLLRRDGKRMGRLRLLKLLYIADRRSIRQNGMPILGTQLIAMKHGPLHRTVYDLINGCGPGEAEWSKHFRNDGRDIVIESELEVTELSRHEIALLNQVSDELVSLQDWDVAELTHEFEEWKKAYPDRDANTSQVIPLEDVIAAVGRGSDSAAIVQDVRDSQEFDRFFSRLGQDQPS